MRLVNAVTIELITKDLFIVATVILDIFSRISIFAMSVKTYMRLENLPISVVNRVILPFCEDFIFTKLRICEVSRK